MQTLPINTLLQSGKYRILDTLGQGGFGITYLAEQTLLDGKVAIKEFFFNNYCDRDEDTSQVIITSSNNKDLVERFKQKFIKEARTLFRLNHPNIVQLHDVFEENGTAYYVMDYIEGESLANMITRRGALPEAEAVGYAKSVADTLSFMHDKKMSHLDIKPSNLMKRNDDGRIIVIDFGTTKQYDAQTSQGTTTTPVGISHGYSPSEQYRKNGVQSFSPQSDVYALAATLYKLLTGVTPPEAMDVQDEGLPTGELVAHGVSPHVITAIQLAMKSRHERTQSIPGFVANLNDVSITQVGDTDEGVTVVAVEADDQVEQRKRKEAEAKAAKEKAAAEARAKAAAALKAREEQERKRKEAEAKAAAERKAREEQERKRKEAEAKAAKEKAEARAKANAGNEQPKAGNKRIVIIAIVVGLLIGFVGFFLLKGKSSPAEQQIGATTSQTTDTSESAPTKVEKKAITLTKGHPSKRNFTYSGYVDEQGLPNGQGTAEYPKTESSGAGTFNGTFSHGLPSDGTMLFTSGTKYKGTFNEEGYYKEGTWTEKDGYYFEGTFSNGDPYDGTWYTPEGNKFQTLKNGKEE